MKHKNLYIKACFALNLSIKISRTHYTPSLSRTHLHSGSTSYSQPFTNPIQMQQDSSRSNTTSWYEGYYGGSPFYIGPVYQGMDPNQHQYRPPRSGPSRERRRKGSRKAEHPYLIQVLHGSSRTVSHNHSTGVNPGMARNDTRNNPGRGKV